MPEWMIAFVTIMAMILALSVIGVPIAFALMAASFAGLIIFTDFSIALAVFENTVFGGPLSLALVPIPLFVFMASVLVETGASQRAYDALARLFSGVTAGLPLATNALLTMFAALTGSSAASIGLITDMATPELQRRGYSNNLIAGLIAGAGGLAVVIPPSVLFILYSFVMDLPILPLFAGGLLPGLLMAVGYGIWIYVMTKLNPPKVPEREAQPKMALHAEVGGNTTKSAAAMREAIVDFKFSEDTMLALEGKLPLRRRLKAALEIVPPMLVAFIMLLSMFKGWASITEGAAVGALGALALAMFYRRMTLRAIWRATISTANITGFIVFIVIGGKFLGAAFTQTGVASEVGNLVSSLPFHGIELLLVVMVVFLIIGMFMEPISIIIVIVPLIVPALVAEGFSPILLGVLVVINMELALTTPPIGMNLFVVSGLAAKYGITFSDVVKGSVRFLIVDGVVMVLCVIYPEIVLYLADRV